MIRAALRWVLAVFYLLAGAIHLARPAPFLTIMPAWVPAHFAMDMARSEGGLGPAYHVPRMIAQPVIIWLALWVGECLPLRRNHAVP